MRQAQAVDQSYSNTEHSFYIQVIKKEVAQGKMSKADGRYAIAEFRQNKYAIAECLNRKDCRYATLPELEELVCDSEEYAEIIDGYGRELAELEIDL